MWLRAFTLIIGSLHVTALATEHFSDHEQFCQQQARAQCYQFITDSLAGYSKHSMQWYKTTSYLVDYHYDRTEFEQVIALLKDYVDNPELPDLFRLQSYFYYAKALNYTGKKPQAKSYADKAFNELEKVYASFNQPLQFIDLANLQYVFGNRHTALQMLQDAERRFGKSKDPIFQFELHSNKGNLLHTLGDLESAAQSRKAALNWILVTTHNKKIIVGMGNLARNYQLLGQYQLADQYYANSLTYMAEGADDGTYAVHTLRLTEINLQDNDPERATFWFKKIKPEHLVQQHHQTLYSKLGAQLSL